jgi:hypothetical protein
MANTETLALTPEMLQTLISTAVTAAVAEAKKPAPPTERQIAEAEQDQENRRANAESVKAKKDQEKIEQLACTHEHPKREGGHTHCVLVREENPASPGYIMCQKCQGRVRPERESLRDKKGEYLDREAIYDTNLFNKLFQDCVVI